MKTIVGTVVIFALCASILVLAILAEEWHVGHYVLSFAILTIGAVIYRVTRWMRGPGSEFGTPVPTLGLTERELDSDKTSGDSL